jgi:hypothetical protein
MVLMCTTALLVMVAIFLYAAWSAGDTTRELWFEELGVLSVDVCNNMAFRATMSMY